MYAATGLARELNRPLRLRRYELDVVDALEHGRSFRSCFLPCLEHELEQAAKAIATHSTVLSVMAATVRAS